jgi:hypothetical protein
VTLAARPKRLTNISAPAFFDGRLPAPIYWRLHNRLAVVVKMIDSNLKEEASDTPLATPFARS